MQFLKLPLEGASVRHALEIIVNCHHCDKCMVVIFYLYRSLIHQLHKLGRGLFE